MTRILTLTMNPCIDGACEAETVQHTHKIRTTAERYDPGGGGINVARVLTRFGADVCALYLAGGPTGAVLDSLLDDNQVPRQRLPIADDTRMSLTVYERSSGREFRFVPEGPDVSEPEWQAALRALEQAECDWLVASGSLPPQAPDDFYAQVRAIAVRRGIRFVLDSSGKALAAGLSGSGVTLVKPSQGELQSWAGEPLDTHDKIANAASALVSTGQADMVAVTMGHEGALLATAYGSHYLPAIPVDVRSAVGAGDSFVAAMTLKLAQGADPLSAFRFGMAAGTAAVLSPGTNLCAVEDVERIFAGMQT